MAVQDGHDKLPPPILCVSSPQLPTLRRGLPNSASLISLRSREQRQPSKSYLPMVQGGRKVKIRDAPRLTHLQECLRRTNGQSECSHPVREPLHCLTCPSCCAAVGLSIGGGLGQKLN